MTLFLLTKIGLLVITSCFKYITGLVGNKVTLLQLIFMVYNLNYFIIHHLVSNSYSNLDL